LATLSYILKFFRPELKSYALETSAASVLRVIRNIPKDTLLWTDSDFQLESLNGCVFVIHLMKTSGAPMPRMTSALKGEITHLSAAQSVIHTRAKPSRILVFLLLLFIAMGVAALIQFFFLGSALKDLFSGVILVFIIRSGLIWYKRLSEYTIWSRFDRLLSEGLRETNRG